MVAAPPTIVIKMHKLSWSKLSSQKLIIKIVSWEICYQKPSSLKLCSTFAIALKVLPLDFLSQFAIQMCMHLHSNRPKWLLKQLYKRSGTLYMHCKRSLSHFSTLMDSETNGLHYREEVKITKNPEAVPFMSPLEYVMDSLFNFLLVYKASIYQNVPRYSLYSHSKGCLLLHLFYPFWNDRHISK